MYASRSPRADASSWVRFTAERLSCLSSPRLSVCLRKSAATNAVQIAELLHERGLVRVKTPVATV